MARLNRTTVPTLRHYDEIGLLKPCCIRRESGYRYYDIKQSARFDMICYMKELGMDLKEIKDVLDSEDLHKIEEILAWKKQQTVKEIEALKIKRDAIGRAITSIERYKKSPAAGTITLEYIRERLIYSVEPDINFYDYDLDTYELVLKQLKEELLTCHIPQVYYCNAGTFLKKEDFCALNFVSHKIFVFIDEHFPLIGQAEMIESGMFACMYLGDFDGEREYAEKLLSHCMEKSYEICGD